MAAGVLDVADAVRLVRARGTFMQEAVPVGVGAMEVVLGLDDDKVEEACREAAQGEVCAPANYNGAGQVVIAGTAAAVARAGEIAKRLGAKRVIAIDPVTPNVAYLGSNGGRVWKTPTCWSASTPWPSGTNDPPPTTLAIGDHVIHPTAHTTAYAGPGPLRHTPFPLRTHPPAHTPDPQTSPESPVRRLRLF